MTAPTRSPMRRLLRTWAALLLVTLLVATACGAEDEPAVEEADAEDAVTGPAEEPAQDEVEPVQIQVDLASLPALDDAARYALWVDTGEGTERAGTLVGAETGGDATVTVDVDTALRTQDIRTLLVAVEAPDTTEGAAMLLGGDLQDGQAALSVDHPAALGATVPSASGSFLLGTPTDPPAPETAGVWFVHLGPTRAALELAPPPDGWVYQGWATVGGTTLSAGRFSAADTAAVGAPHNGPQSGPPLPGGDFVADPPEGVAFPWELHGARVQVALAPAAFELAVPLVAVLEGETPDPAEDHVSYPLAAPEALPTGHAVLQR